MHISFSIVVFPIFLPSLLQLCIRLLQLCIRLLLAHLPQVNDFLKAAADEAKGYASNDIIMTMGSDFNYQSADMYYKNIDKLIR